jgi:multicomponent Na+:H+ antiporter subunit E
MTATHPRLAWGLQAAAVLLLVWLALDGTGSLWVGVLAAALGGLVGAVIAPAMPYGWRPWPLLSFAGYFVVESLRGAFDVAWRAMHPGLPITPRLSDYEIALPDGKPRTLFVGVVSLLPGTLSAALSADGRILKVHAITADPGEDLRRLEQRIARLFGLAPEGGA